MKRPTKEKQNEYNKKWRENNPDKYQAAVRKHRFTKYGMTLEDYNRMFADQEGKCFACKTHQTDLSKALAVDHDHATGKIRKLLCMSCNLILGNAKDNPELLRILANYLETQL